MPKFNRNSWDAGVRVAAAFENLNSTFYRKFS